MSPQMSPEFSRAQMVDLALDDIAEAVTRERWKKKVVVSIWSPWIWAGVAFLILGGAASYVMPRPLGSLLSILGLVVFVATATAEVMLARYYRSLLVQRHLENIRREMEAGASQAIPQRQR